MSESFLSQTLDLHSLTWTLTVQTYKLSSGRLTTLSSNKCFVKGWIFIEKTRKRSELTGRLQRLGFTGQIMVEALARWQLTAASPLPRPSEGESVGLLLTQALGRGMSEQNEAFSPLDASRIGSDIGGFTSIALRGYSLKLLPGYPKVRSHVL